MNPASPEPRDELYQSTPAMLHSIDPQARLLAVSDTWLTHLGYAREEVIGRSAEEFMTAASACFAREVAWPAFFACGRATDVEFQYVRKDGSVIDVLVNAVLQRDAHGAPLRTLAVLQDVTARKQAERALAESRELLEVTLESIADGVITTDPAGRVQWLNPVAARLTGWTSAQARGRDAAEIFRVVDEETRRPAPNPVACCLADDPAHGAAAHTLLLSRDGPEYAIEESASAISDRDGRLRGVVLVFRDVTAQRRLSHEMRHRATHDTLTGLLNRAEFESRMGEVLAATTEGGPGHALMYIDLDQFKIVNDSCGHSVGDHLLRQVATLLAARVRKRDSLARLGGDEFGVILEHCTPEQADRVAQQICDDMDLFRFVHDGKPYRI
ncbi:MAG: PAS domain S-box protein, partial [Gammaproteobacteria bacterium]